jgi:hypothetical protein
MHYEPVLEKAYRSPSVPHSDILRPRWSSISLNNESIRRFRQVPRSLVFGKWLFINSHIPKIPFVGSWPRWAGCRDAFDGLATAPPYRHRTVLSMLFRTLSKSKLSHLAVASLWRDFYFAHSAKRFSRLIEVIECGSAPRSWSFISFLPWLSPRLHGVSRFWEML